MKLLRYSLVIILLFMTGEAGAGEGTKVVLTGDIFQIDHPYLNSYSNGLSYLIDKMQGQNLYAHVNLEKGERSELADLASTIL